VLERREGMNTEEIFQQVMNENCKDPLHRFAELVRQDERERIWVGLTDEEIAQTVGSPIDEVYLVDFRRVIEKLRSKNT
jgi:hypothetical protein